MNILIVGGAGFIGVNNAAYFAPKHDVTILDNFSRKGTEENAKWLASAHPNVKIVRADIVKDQDVLDAEVEKADVVIHLAAQVAVTTSVEDPRTDFMTNALGTLNLLEAARKTEKKPMVLYSSTNKVYGKTEQLAVIEKNGRYEYRDHPNGVDESVPLDFYSPYGCSKGAADQYVRDYHRIYGLDTVVFRQSCIYGTQQFGSIDQGWLAHFAITAVKNRPLTIFGDGKQIRDVLFVDDLSRLFELAIEKREIASGKIYNVGGGSQNTLSLLELIELIEQQTGKKMRVSYDDWRPGDQKVFVADITKAKNELGWEPNVRANDGVTRLISWVMKNQALF